ncbi:hypothetical protein C8F01DRAFT_1321537 [Mycena amicta]|nr:hypothetical protein C8F01DRAFT_1321537 [Mycena amicta]
MSPPGTIHNLQTTTQTSTVDHPWPADERGQKIGQAHPPLATPRIQQPPAPAAAAVTTGTPMGQPKTPALAPAPAVAARRIPPPRPPKRRPAQKVEPTLTPAATVTVNWFSETFLSGKPRSVVALALRSGISDIVQELSPELARAQGTISAEILDEPTPLKKVNRLFLFLDEQSTDKELVFAFQRAVVKRGGIEYLMNPDLPTVLITPYMKQTCKTSKEEVWQKKTYDDSTILRWQRCSRASSRTDSESELLGEGGVEHVTDSTAFPYSVLEGGEELHVGGVRVDELEQNIDLVGLSLSQMLRRISRDDHDGGGAGDELARAHFVTNGPCGIGHSRPALDNAESVRTPSLRYQQPSNDLRTRAPNTQNNVTSNLPPLPLDPYMSKTTSQLSDISPATTQLYPLSSTLKLLSIEITAGKQDLYASFRN